MQGATYNISNYRPDILKAKVIKWLASINKKDIIVSDFMIRKEQKITQNLSFQFTLGEITNQKRPLEVSLNQSDAVIPYAMAWGVSKVPVSATLDLAQNSQFYTYPSPKVFNFAGAPGTQPEYAALQSLWYGLFNMKSNQNEIFDSMNAYPMLQAPMIQETAASTDYNSYQNSPQFVEMPCNPLLMGNKTNVISFVPPTGGDVANVGGDTAVATNWAVLYLRCLRIRGLAQSWTLGDGEIKLFD